MSDIFGDISSISNINDCSVEQRLRALEDLNHEIKEQFMSHHISYEHLSKLQCDTPLVDNSQSLIYAKSEEIKNLQSKIQLLESANKDMDSRINNCRHQASQYSKANQYYKEVVIPQLTSQIELLRNQSLTVEHLEESEVFIYKRRTTKSRKRLSMGNIEMLKRHHSVVKATQNNYTPSFLRKRLHTLKKIF